MVGRRFRIRLRPEEYTEHRMAPLSAFDGRTCRLTAQVRGPLYETDLEVPAGTPDSDFARGGRLVVMTDKDGEVVYTAHERTAQRIFGVVEPTAEQVAAAKSATFGSRWSGR